MGSADLRQPAPLTLHTVQRAEREQPTRRDMFIHSEPVNGKWRPADRAKSKILNRCYVAPSVLVRGDGVTPLKATTASRVTSEGGQPLVEAGQQRFFM